jgi:hypothetical protein
MLLCRHACAALGRATVQIQELSSKMPRALRFARASIEPKVHLLRVIFIAKNRACALVSSPDFLTAWMNRHCALISGIPGIISWTR